MTLAAFFVPLFATATVHADAATDRARAREAYDRATRAYDKGDYATAAREYADADAIAPTSASLEAALEAAMRADDPARGQELVARAETRTIDKATENTVAAARARFANRAARVIVECATAATCVVAIDGVAQDARAPVFVKVGAHTIVLQRDEERIERLVDVKAPSLAFPPRPEATSSPPPATLSPPPSAPAEPATAAAEPTHGISPVFFYVGLGLTAAAGTAGVAFAIDTITQHQAYVDHHCTDGTGVASECASRSNNGKDAQLRTNVAFAVTGGLAVGSAALGLFAVRWQKDEKTAVALGVSPGGVALELATP
jgi:hypothetical protein